MEKKQVTFEQLVAGAILKFKEIDNTDLTLLIEGLKKINIAVDGIDSPLNLIKDYIQTSNGRLSIKEEFSLNSYSSSQNKSDYTLESLLETVQGPIIAEYLGKLNLEDFVLRKIQYFNCISTQKFDMVFNPIQKDIIEQLSANFGDRLISKRWNDFIIYDSYEELYVNQLGLAHLFKEDHKKEIASFIDQLIELGYNPNLLTKFLSTQDLQKGPQKVLTIQNFNDYGNIYDICLRNSNNFK